MNLPFLKPVGYRLGDMRLSLQVPLVHLSRLDYPYPANNLTRPEIRI
jgi:hypothetical protein